MQKANTEYIESLESEILQLEQEWSDALAGIRVQDYASYEEYQEAIDLGITDGSRPNDPVTRLEAAIMALRAAKAGEQD